MIKTLTKFRYLGLSILLIFAAGLACADAYGQKKAVKPAPQKPTADTSDSAEPDKVLYDRAMLDMKHGRFTEERLTLQTLINTYPDSEYLAKAKLGIADSYYKEGSTSNMTLAIQEYKDFITFFPFLDEAAYAQLQVGMAHFRMMEKSDRDSTQAQAAEEEFQTFLLKYPQDSHTPQAEQKLREVQEILADSQYGVARFYYLKATRYPPAYQAAAARLVELTQRYPLYSQSDEALWMLGDIYFRAKQQSKNEDDKNHWADLAGQCYRRLVRDYPLSRLAADAKSRLSDMGMPVPSPDPNAVARMEKEQLYEKTHHQSALLKMPMSMVKSSPDVAMAAHSGQPNLNPPDDSVSATEILRSGASGPSFDLSARPAGVDSGLPAQAVASGPSSSAPGTNAEAQILDAPNSGSATTPAAEYSSSSPSSQNPPTSNDPGNLAPSSPEPVGPGSDAPPSLTTPTAATGTNGGSGSQPESAKADPKTESTSKKKKGLHKLNPF